MKLGIVNDMAMAVEVLRRVVESDGSHQVVWTARDGAEAVRKCADHRPDAVLMDLIMPIMDGVEATRAIMAASPCAILIVTSSVGRNTSRVFEALGAGALDAVRTPIVRGEEGGEKLLLAKLRLIQRLVGAERGGRARNTQPQPVPPGPSGGAAPLLPLVAVGASSGGPGALATLLKGIPGSFPGCVAIVQHIDREFAPGLVQWLASSCKLPVRLARDQERPEPSTVRVCEGGRHLVLSPAGLLRYTDEPRDSIHKPSVDVFFQSVAHHWRGTAVGVILTGMGRDGADGLAAMVARGHKGIAQDRDTSAIYGMPAAAVRTGAVSEVLPLPAIAGRVVELLGRG
ncbi:MAG: chemotaxis response regulator protein-glutamate methylesterase [Armatimonadetes bacterium]|nr:chemotaxis response regulator protein-glutamate methylesterase [Armatimonadota bacterium]